VAYDLLLRKQTRTNWSRRSYCGPRGILLLASETYEFAPDPTPATDEEKQFIAKLAVLKMAADAGNKKSAKEWKATLAKLEQVKKKAAAGDEKSKHLVVVLKESGIFDGVQAMSVTGESCPKLEIRAAAGDVVAQQSLACQRATGQCAGDNVPPELQGRRDARKILDEASQAKSISRADLRRAIWLHAGKQSTEAERAAVGGKMLDFLNKRQVKLSS
jgi:hypothetical protein